MRPPTTTIGPKLTIVDGDDADDAGGAEAVRVVAADAAAGADAADGADAAPAGRPTSCRLRWPLSSSTMRAKNSLSVVSAVLKRVAVPGVMANSMPRIESVFQLSSCRLFAASAVIGRPRR